MRKRDFAHSLLGLAIIFGIFAFSVWLSQWVPLPGALIGLLILLLGFFVYGDVPECIAIPWQFMLKHMSLFFVPAFVSVPLYQAQIVKDFWALFLTIFVATVLCMAVIGAATERWYQGKVSKSDLNHD